MYGSAVMSKYVRVKDVDEFLHVSMLMFTQDESRPRRPDKRAGVDVFNPSPPQKREGWILHQVGPDLHQVRRLDSTLRCG